MGVKRLTSIIAVVVYFYYERGPKPSLVTPTPTVYILLKDISISWSFVTVNLNLFSDTFYKTLLCICLR